MEGYRIQKALDANICFKIYLEVQSVSVLMRIGGPRGSFGMGMGGPVDFGKGNLGKGKVITRRIRVDQHNARNIAPFKTQKSFRRINQ